MSNNSDDRIPENVTELIRNCLITTDDAIEEDVPDCEIADPDYIPDDEEKSDNEDDEIGKQFSCYEHYSF